MADRAQVIDLLTATNTNEPFPFDFFERRCLAQGDSWFSIGALPPTRTTRVVAELRLERSTVVVNCAKPGAVLQRMTNTSKEVQFLKLLRGRMALKWDALLISGGGNDLIDAVGSAPTGAPKQRLLRTPAERGNGPLSGAGYISEPGWQVFSDHIGAVFNQLVDERDSGVNRGTPLVWHNYARVMPRPAGAGLGFGPWLLPAIDLYQVPAADRLLVSDELIGRLGKLVADIIAARRAQDPDCNLHIADSQSAGLDLAAPDSEDESGDWINEIHPTRNGYRKVASAYAAVLDALFA
jgi:hypothetical protein